jgi:hypothetical protein
LRVHEKPSCSFTINFNQLSTQSWKQSNHPRLLNLNIIFDPINSNTNKDLWYNKWIMGWNNFWRTIYFFLHALCTWIYMRYLGPKCLPRVACSWSKMPMLWRVGMRKRGVPLPLAFQYLILMIWRPWDLNFVMICSLASKCKHFKLRGLQFHS